MKVKFVKTERAEGEGNWQYIQDMKEAGWVAEEIDGEEPLDTCETCGLPIIEGQAMQGDREGVVWHVKCPV